MKKKIIIGLCCFVALIAYNRYTVSMRIPSSEVIDNVVKRLPVSTEYLCVVDFGKHSGEERSSFMMLRMWNHRDRFRDPFSKLFADVLCSNCTL